MTWPTHDDDGYPLAGPRVGDLVWINWNAEDKTGGDYRRITELVGWTEDEEPQLKFHALDNDGALHLMAVKLPEFRPTPELEDKRLVRHTPATPGELVHVRAGTAKHHVSAEMRRDVAHGTKCRARGHDLTINMPDGKPVLYVSPHGRKECRMCKIDTAAARAQKVLVNA
jgi:hypothetical protein